MDTLIKFLPKSISMNQTPATGARSVEMICECVGPIDTDFHKMMQDAYSGKKHLVILSDYEYAMMSTDSKKLSLILQEVLELKDLIKNNHD